MSVSDSKTDLFENVLDFTERSEFREWLREHHSSERGCWIALKRGRGPAEGRMRYLDAVEEALCFGWIDTTVKTVGGTAMQKFMPRSGRGRWSELNKERCRRLEKLGLMTDAGRAVLPDMSPDGFVMDAEIEEAFRRDPVAWENFRSFPDLYQRVRIDTVQRDKSDRKAFERRLEKLIERSRRGEMFGDWNDGGRLTEY